MIVCRTIRNGSVRINGKTYFPSDRWKEYDGRMDGIRCAFGVYFVGDRQQGHIALWGTEENYKESGKETSCLPDMSFGLVGNSYPWYWWYTKEEKARLKAMWARLDKEKAQWDS